MSQPRTPGRSPIATGTLPVHGDHLGHAPAIESSLTGTYGLRWWRHIQHEKDEGAGKANRRRLRWQRRGGLRDALPARGHRADFGVNGAEKGLVSPERGAVEADERELLKPHTRIVTTSAVGMRIAFVSSSLPRRCGIATFSADLMAAVKAADPHVICRVAAIDEPNEVRSYGDEVRWRIRQGDPNSYRAAAEAINDSDVDIVNVQHEFGLYGTWTEGVYEDHLRPFLEALRKPVTITLHTLPPEPTASMREAVRTAAELSDAVVVMAEAAVGLLASQYGIVKPPLVIPHGMPAISPHGRVRMKEKLDVPGRIIISTFGLVDPRKGLEYMIEAMPAVVARHPQVLYLIAGQTHPELRRRDGERYRNRLIETVERLALQRHVSFIDQYMAQRDIVELLLASDVYVTPYLDPQQITSGTLAYALGAGKAIVSTPYLHAKEALADDRGILVRFRDSAHLAEAINSLLDHTDRKQALELRAYAYAKDMSWPKSGEHWLVLMRLILAGSLIGPRLSVA